MWTLSGFVDEIDDDFAVQCAVARDLGLRFIEFRSAWGVNVLDLTDAQLADVRRILAEHDLQVSSIGSPIGKIRIDEPFEPHLRRTAHAIDVAQLLGAPFIRIFSFFIPAGDDPAMHRDEVMTRMRAIAELAERGNVTLLHENEKDIYGDTPERCLDLLTTVDSPALRATWDPANFVQVCGANPFDAGWAMLRPHIVYMQIKDAIADTGAVVPAGEGDGQLRATVAALAADGFDGFFSLEPHLGSAHALGGFSGPDLWRSAHRAFTGLLREQGIEFR